MIRKLLILLVLTLVTSQTRARERLILTKVNNHVYAIVGEIGNRTINNLGNNATFGFVITSAGVVLIDAGATFNGAQKIHEMIKSVTDKPVVKVINTGGQDHRWLGNSYFKQLGAQIIATEEAVKDQKARVNDQIFILGVLVGEKEVKLTNPVYANKTFKQNLNFNLGETSFEIYHAGQAHTPGDSFVWLPKESIMFTGDIVYTERMLGILDHSNSKSWIQTYEAMAAFNPKTIIPGHGKPTTLTTANKDTYDYLISLRLAVSDFMDKDGDIADINQIDQSKFANLFNSSVLAGRNAQQVFTEMEME